MCVMKTDYHLTTLESKIIIIIKDKIKYFKHLSKQTHNRSPQEKIKSVRNTCFNTLTNKYHIVRFTLIINCEIKNLQTLPYKFRNNVYR